MNRRATLGGAAHAGTLSRKLDPFSTRSARSHRFTWALLATLSVMACADAGGPVVPELEPEPEPSALANAELVLVSGDDQEGEVGIALSEPLAVQVRDSLARPLAGVQVEWVFTQGAGRGAGRAGSATSSVIVQTDQDGNAAVEWELGTTAGFQEAEAGIVLPAGVTPPSNVEAAPRSGWGNWRRWRARARPGAIRSVAVSPDRVDALVGDTVRFAANVADRYGNTIESALIEWRSTDESIAHAESDGVVEVMSAGNASVIAASGGREGTASVNAEEPTGPRPPSSAILSPSNDTTIVVGESVTFVGSASDPDGTVTGHAWDFGDGSTSSLADPGSHTYTTEGAFDVTYVTTDDQGLQSAAATVNVAVISASNQLPTASIDSPTPGTTVQVGEAIDFRGSAADADGSISRHRWTFGDGSSSAVEDPGSRSYDAPGTYSVTYRVWDDQNARSQVARVSVTVEAGNAAPSASITSPSTNRTVTVGETLQFQGSASDPDGSVSRHEWSFGDGTTSTLQNPGTRSYGSAGTYAVTYRVWDDEDAVSNTATRTITVEDTPSNQRPTASITSPSGNVTISVGGSVDFRGSASDSDGTVVSHSWDFGDGTSSSQQNPGAHSYASQGTYSVSYRVTDDGGLTSTPATRTVTVTSSEPPPPPYVPHDVYFATDWSTATGTSTNAILDGGKWSQGSGNWTNSFSVQARGSLPFPTENVLVQRGIAEMGSWGQIELLAGAVPLLQVGDSLGMRVYWQSPNPYGNVDNLLHGFEVLDPGNDPIGINSRYEGGGWQIEIDIPSAEVYGPRGPSGMGAFDLTPNGVYMLEVLAVRVATNQIHVAARLTDAATGNVIRGEYDWESYYDPNARPLHEDSPFTTTSNSWQHLREWRMGINGIGNVGGEVVHRWGGFALCSSWCGPYPIPGHEGS